nr:uncharacterized protein LOC105330893 isoform X1 [Crassostrea gigas]
MLTITLFRCLFVVSFLYTLKAMHQKRYAEHDICNGTNATIIKVDYCPNNKIQLKRRSKMKMCNNFPNCMGEPLVYHCVRYKNDIVEVCAPRSIIRGNCCTLYDAGLGRVVEDFGRQCPECPFQYQSDDFIENSTCLETSVQINRENYKSNGCGGTNVSDTEHAPCRDSNKLGSEESTLEPHFQNGRVKEKHWYDLTYIILYITGSTVISMSYIIGTILYYNWKSTYILIYLIYKSCCFLLEYHQSNLKVY